MNNTGLCLFILDRLRGAACSVQACMTGSPMTNTRRLFNFYRAKTKCQSSRPSSVCFQNQNHVCNLGDRSFITRSKATPWASAELRTAHSERNSLFTVVTLAERSNGCDQIGCVAPFRGYLPPACPTHGGTVLHQLPLRVFEISKVGPHFRFCALRRWENGTIAASESVTCAV